jgi:hypothetical protein
LEVDKQHKNLHNEEQHNFQSSPNIIHLNDKAMEDDMGRAYIMHERE